MYCAAKARFVSDHLFSPLEVDSLQSRKTGGVVKGYAPMIGAV